MMGAIKTGNVAHDNAIAAAAGARQSAVKAAGTPQATARAADIAFYRAVIASAVANGLPSAQFGAPLRDLGTGGA